MIDPGVAGAVNEGVEAKKGNDEEALDGLGVEGASPGEETDRSDKSCNGSKALNDHRRNTIPAHVPFTMFSASLRTASAPTLSRGSASSSSSTTSIVSTISQAPPGGNFEPFGGTGFEPDLEEPLTVAPAVLAGTLSISVLEGDMPAG